MDQATELLQRRAEARVGQMLRDKWRLDALLGVGGMACVYAATHRVGQRGAVKILHSELSIDESARGRFLREGYVANRVRHRGAVAVVDDDIAEDGSVYLVMELLEGETYEQRAERLGGRLDPAEVIYMAAQVLDVLRAAHAAEIIHRDLKPDNLFLTNDGVVKVLDFGIARLRETSVSFRATRSGSTLGTPAFMSPEQARGIKDTVDARSDIWALGATMYSLLTGRLVHEADTVNMVLLAAMTRPAPAVRSFAPHVAEALGEFVDRALAFDPAARFQSAGEMLEALRPLGPGALVQSASLPGATPYVTGASAAPGSLGPVAQASTPPPAGPNSQRDAVGGLVAMGPQAAPNPGPWRGPKPRGPDLVTASPVSRDSVAARGAFRSQRALVGALLAAATLLVALLVLFVRSVTTPTNEAVATSGAAARTASASPSDGSSVFSPPTASAANPSVEPARDDNAAPTGATSEDTPAPTVSARALKAAPSARPWSPVRPGTRPAPHKPGADNPLGRW